MADEWKIKNDDDVSKELIEILKQNTKESKENYACIVKEYQAVIKTIHKIQQEFLDSKHPNNVNWIASQINSIDIDNLNKDELIGTVLSTLYKCAPKTLHSMFKDKIPMDDIDLHIKNPRNKNERLAGFVGIDNILNGCAYADFLAICECLLSVHTIKYEQNEREFYIQQLIKKALDTDFLSAEEAELKIRLAIYIYIKLNNDKSFNGIPMAVALQKSMFLVTDLKYLYKIQQKGIAKKLKRYLESGYFVTLITMVKRVITSRHGKNLTSSTLYFYKELSKSGLKHVIDNLPVNKEIKTIFDFGGNITIEFIYKYIEPKIYKILCDIAKNIKPNLQIDINKKAALLVEWFKILVEEEQSSEIEKVIRKELTD